MRPLKSGDKRCVDCNSGATLKIAAAKHKAKSRLASVSDGGTLADATARNFPSSSSSAPSSSAKTASLSPVTSSSVSWQALACSI